MCSNGTHAKSSIHVADERSSGQILRSSKLGRCVSLCLDTDGKVVYTLTSAPTRHTSVPGAIQHADELNHFTIPAHKKMSGHAKRCHLREQGLVRCDAVGEESLNRIAVKLTARKADVVQHNQINRCEGRTSVKIRRCNMAHAFEPTINKSSCRIH